MKLITNWNIASNKWVNSNNQIISKYSLRLNSIRNIKMISSWYNITIGWWILRMKNHNYYKRYNQLVRIINIKIHIEIIRRTMIIYLLHRIQLILVDNNMVLSHNNSIKIFIINRVPKYHHMLNYVKTMDRYVVEISHIQIFIPIN